ncbi:MAG: GAF domain-containing protein [Spirochaetia bacterium]|nr:GAF domain-containing protein [Spirochaetia bacterium]
MKKNKNIIYVEKNLNLQKIQVEGANIKSVLLNDEDIDIELDELFAIWVLSHDHIKENEEKFWNLIRAHAGTNHRIILIVDKSFINYKFDIIPDDIFYQIFYTECDETLLSFSIKNAFDTLKLFSENLKLQTDLTLSSQDIHGLTKVGQALGTERDFDKLIELILLKARELVSADGGSIYLTERKKNNEPATHLRFKKSALDLTSNEFLLPIDAKSIAGYVAYKGEHLMLDDVYDLDPKLGFSFNKEYDKIYNYHSKSMMVIPIKNHKEQVIGVLQLINKKKNFYKKLTPQEMETDEIVPFTQKCFEMVSSLAGQAAVAIENNLLLQDIENLFEGFVKASITAIEQRDPTTSGHSFRVAEYTIDMAKKISGLKSKPFENIKFSKDKIKELRYAALLHDFGKVGVRERVLVKPKKLYESELDVIKWRFRYVHQQIEKDAAFKKLEYIRKKGVSGFEDYEKNIDIETIQKVKEFEDMFETINASNESVPMPDDVYGKLQDIAKQRIKMPNGVEIPFLQQNELLNLMIKYGNLNSHERTEIESHVTHTYEFLIKIPWTSDLKNVPDIAYKHHEKLDGTGYPQNVNHEEIPIEVRMLSIADIFDALTALDRPYRKALNPERAIDILKEEVKDGHLDKDILDLFIESGIYRKAYKT